MSEIADIFGMPVSLTLKVGEQDVSVKLSRFGPEIEMMFSDWIKNKALLSVQKMRGKLDDETYAMAVSRIADKDATGGYSARSPAWDAAMKETNGNGFRHLFYCCAKRCQPQMRDMEILKLFDDNPKDCMEALKYIWGKGTPASEPANSPDSAKS